MQDDDQIITSRAPELESDAIAAGPRQDSETPAIDALAAYRASGYRDRKAQKRKGSVLEPDSSDAR